MRLLEATLVTGLVLTAVPVAPGAGTDPVGTAAAEGSSGWETLPPVPTPRTEVSSAVLDGDLFVIGGVEIVEETSPVMPLPLSTPRVEAMDLGEESWRTTPPLPVPLHHTKAVAVDGEIHVFGGYNTVPFVQPTDLHFVWSPDVPVWQPAERLPTPRAAHGAAVFDGDVYLVGGVSGFRTFAQPVDVYDPDTGTWSQAEALPTPREHLAAAVTEAGIHAVGGRHFSIFQNMDAHEVLVPGEGWSDAADLPTARGGLDAAEIDGRLVAAGGEEPGGAFDEVEVYHPGNDTWTELPPMPTPRHGLGLSVHGDRLIAAAGGPDDGPAETATVEAFTVGPDTFGG